MFGKRSLNLFFVFVLVLSAFSLVSFSKIAYAKSDLPVGLQKIIDYNNKHTSDLSRNISFAIAFLAGILVILSPCVLPLFPAYFSYTFKEKKNITLMTFVFFLGFSLVFVSVGVIAGFVGAQTLLVLQPSWLVMLSGVFLIYLAYVTLFNKKACPFINTKRFKNDVPGTFLFGIFFALGWTACLGPILSGILAISAILGDVWKAAFLMFFYSLGNLVPLVALSILYDKKGDALKRFNSKMVSVGRYKFPISNLISSILFVLIGMTLILFQGTGIVNTWDFLGTKKYFYSIQNQMLGWQYINELGILVFVIFIGMLFYFLYGHYRKSRGKLS